MKELAEYIAANNYLLVGANVLSVLITVRFLFRWLVSLKFALIDIKRLAQGKVSRRKRRLWKIAIRSQEVQGYFAAFASRHTVVVTICILFVTISFNLVNVIAALEDPTNFERGTAFGLYWMIIFLSATALWRLLELYTVSEFVLRRSRG